MPDLLSNNSKEQMIKIVKTTPKAAQEQLFENRKCYIGISLDNKVFYGKSFDILLGWATEKFDSTLIVIGDYLRRYNEYIFNGLEGADAYDKSIKAGDKFLEQASETLKRYADKGLEITRWKPCIENETFDSNKKIVDSLYSNDQAFKAAVQKDAFSFIKRQQNNTNQSSVSTEKAIELSSQYLLEEIAVFSSLSQQGYKIEIYPGPELHCLLEVAKGNFQAIPPGLKQRINVEVKVQN